MDLATPGTTPVAPGDQGRRPLRIAMVAPPWIPVPPPGYGGIEAVVGLLCEELVRRGHDVTLFAAPGSRSPARVRTPLEVPWPDEIGQAVHEADHVGAAWDAIEASRRHGDPFDLIHDHTGATAIAMASRAPAPVVQTVHLPFSGAVAALYARHGRKAALVALSRAQAQQAPPAARIAAVVGNPIAVERWPLCADKDDYLLWIGRMDPVKGAHRAIEAARRARRTLVLAGPVQPGQERYFHEQVEPHVDGVRIRYAGEVSGPRKQWLYARAAAMLMPIRWAEPFGMVMVEALAKGTPVIAFAEGSATEIVVDGVNGRLVADAAAMARAVRELGGIDPAACRRSVVERFSPAAAADGYEAVYRAVAARSRGAGRALRGTADAGPGAERMTAGRRLGSVGGPRRP